MAGDEVSEGLEATRKTGFYSEKGPVIHSWKRTEHFYLPNERTQQGIKVSLLMKLTLWREKTMS